jgi:replicative DNA helicase
MVVVGARPGVGKTSYAASVLLNIAKAGKRVGFVSSEMSASQVMLRLTALESDIAGHKLRDADLDELDWSRLTATTSRLAALNVRIYDKPAITSADVMMQCKAWMIDGGIDFVVIDYLTRIKSVKSIGNQNLDVGEVVTTMKNIARTLNIPVMVLAQLNRDAANRRPVMSDLRDSGIIEQEADQILMLYRDKDDELAPAEIIIEKNRHGESMCIVQCHFDRKTMRWANIARGNDD